MLYLCGTDRLARGVREELAARSGGTSFTGNVVTLTQVLGHYSSPGEVVASDEIELRVWAELRRSQPRRALGGTLSFTSAMVDLWDLLRKEGKPEVTTAPERTLELLLGPVLSVERSLAAKGLLDDTGLLQELPRRIRKDPLHLETLVVDGFEGYPPLLASIIEALAESAEEAWVLTEGETLHPPSWSVEKPMSLGSQAGTRPATEGPARPPAVPGAVLDSWVQRETPERGPRPLPNVRMLQGVGGEREEVEAIASAVRQALNEDPTLRVLVAMPALPTYAPRVLEVFPRYGLRPEVLLPSSLLAAPGAQPLRRILELLLSDLPHASMLELIEDLDELGTLPKFFPRGATAEMIGRVAREGRAVAGREAFTTLLRAHAAELRAEGDEGGAREAEGVALGFGKLLETLRPLEAPAAPTAFVSTLRDVMVALGYLGPSTSEEGAVVLDALASAAAGLPVAGPPWPLGELRQFVEIVLSLRQSGSAARLPGIPVTGLHDAGLLSADLVILGGLSEANLPSDRPSPLLPPGARARAGLPTGEELVHRERVRLARVLARAGRTVVLSYPTRSGDEEVLPSPLLNDLLAVATPTLGAPAAPMAAPPTRAYAISEAMAGVARELGQPSGPSPSAIATLRLGLSGHRAEAWRSMLRGIRVERDRRASPRSTPFDGPMGGNGARELARKHFSSGRFTVHDLQDYLRCPYRFYLERVLRLQGPEEVTDEVDRPAVGSEIHHQLFVLQNSLRGTDGKLTGLTEKEAQVRGPSLQTQLRTFLDTLRPRTPDLETLTVRFLGTGGAAGRSGIATLLSQLVEDQSVVRSAHLELPFDDREPRSGSDIDPQLRLPPLPLGEVDSLHPVLVGRIDRLGFGQGRTSGVVIDDYKTGRSRPKDQDAAREAVPAGLELQLPLYMAAALYGLREKDPSVFPLGMRYLWISSAYETGFVSLLRLPQKPREEARQRERGVAYVEIALRHAQNAAQGILLGRFPINGRFASADGGCQFAGYCGFAQGCRFNGARFALRGVS